MSNLFEEEIEIEIDQDIFSNLFQQILEIEYKNKHTKQYSDKDIQDRIKKIIQVIIKN